MARRDDTPISWRECFAAAQRLQGMGERRGMRDTDRVGYLPAWAAYRCSDVGVSFPVLARDTGYAHSTVSGKVYEIDRTLSPEDRKAIRAAIREAALRARERKPSAADPELMDRVRAIAGKEWRYGRGRPTRMNPEMVRSIRATCIPVVMLARFLGIPSSQVSYVRSRRTWKWVD